MVKWNQQNKRSAQLMLKKYIITALLIIGLVTSGFGQIAGAAEKNVEQKEVHKVVFDQGSFNKSQIENFIKECLSKWNITWKQQLINQGKEQNKVETPNNEEKPNQQVEEVPVEQPEQPKIEEPNFEQPVEKEEQPTNNVEQPAPTQPQPQQPVEENKNNQTNGQDQLVQLNQYEQQVVELTNQERAKYGLKPLAIDYELSRVAREKSRDMAVNNYFDHNSPVYGSPFDMMRSYGINYRTAGENIAKGQRSPQEVVNAWMNSPGHRANILSADFTHIGVGYVSQGNHWTQQFIGK